MTAGRRASRFLPRLGRGRPKHDDVLTPREWEVMALLEEGLTNEQIAERLGVSFHAAKYHVSEIISKLGVGTREEAVRWARQQRQASPALAPLSFAPSHLIARLPWLAAGAAALALVAYVASAWSFGGGRDAGVVLPSGALADAPERGDSLERAALAQRPQPGQVLYTKVEVYQRWGPKADEISRSTGHPSELSVGEAWRLVGDDGETIVRLYSRVSAPDGRLIQETLYEGGLLHTRQHTQANVCPAPAPCIGATSPPESLTLNDLYAQMRRYTYDVPDTEVASGPFAFESRQAAPPELRNRNYPPGTFRIPFDGDLSTVEHLTRAQGQDGLVVWRETYAVSEEGVMTLIETFELLDWQVLDDMPEGFEP